MLAEAMVLWTHALGALLFGALTLWALTSSTSLPRRPLAVALALTALWALTVAGIGGREPATRIAEAARDLSWFGVMLAIWRRSEVAPQPVALGIVYGVLACVTVAAALVAVAVHAMTGNALVPAAMLLRIMVMLAALILLHHLHATAGGTRADTRLVAAAMALVWLTDLTLLSVAYLWGEWPAAVAGVRGIALALAAGLVAAALFRPVGEVQVSRSAAVQSLSIAAIGLYLAAMVLATSAIGAFGGSQGRVAQTAFVFGAAAALLTLARNPWLRAWAKVKLAKHLFRHRYDYRAEWIRFTETLGQPGAAAAPLAERMVKAVGDLIGSPAGLLFVTADEELVLAARWNWPAGEAPTGAQTGPLVRYLAGAPRILELDAIRAGDAEPCEIAALPADLIGAERGWALVPLLHLDRLAGAILLARPPVARALDWEDFDLLRIAGRQVASYLAEAQAQAALADAQRFDEFNRRFAFILHDLKNLVSQLSLTARNAERHADNPAFRADMVATLRESAERMTELLARLSQRGPTRAEPPAPMSASVLVGRIAARRRRLHPVEVAIPPGVRVVADPHRLEQILEQLIQNAVEASPADAPVGLRIVPDGAWVAIEVVDRGCGMSPAFIRDKLFRPFASSKPNGFGLGAYEARALAQAMGGRLEVESREGEGSRFRVLLPAAPVETPMLEHAA